MKKLIAFLFPSLILFSGITQAYEYQYEYKKHGENLYKQRYSNLYGHENDMLKDGLNVYFIQTSTFSREPSTVVLAKNINILKKQHNPNITQTDDYAMVLAELQNSDHIRNVTGNSTKFFAVKSDTVYFYGDPVSTTSSLQGSTLDDYLKNYIIQLSVLDGLIKKAKVLFQHNYTIEGTYNNVMRVFTIEIKDDEIIIIKDTVSTSFQ